MAGSVGVGLEELDANVAHARQSVSVELDSAVWHVELQVDGLDEGKSGT